MKEKVTIVVPFYNEEETVEGVLHELLKFRPEDEIIAVDDGSQDSTWAKMTAIQGIRPMRFKKNCGQSAAIYAGLKQAKGDICVLMDGDGQNDPEDISTLIECLKDGDVVCGYRKNRKDNAWKRFESRVGYLFRQMFLKDGIRDTGCSLKAFRREAVSYLVPFNGMHRFLPAVFKEAGLSLVEVPVNHRVRLAGVTKYGNLTRGLRGLYDLFGMSWLIKRQVNFPKKVELYE